MKRIILVGIMLLSLTLSQFIGVAAADAESSLQGLGENAELLLNERIRLEADKAWEATSLSELEKMSEWIVEGYLANDGKQNLQKTSNGMIKFGVTISTLHITRAYKGNMQAIKENNTISIGETYYIKENDDKSYDLYYYSNYLPSKTGEDNKYLFFLNPTPKDGQFGGAYFPVDRENGRYPILTEDEKSAGLGKLTKSRVCLGEGSSASYAKLLAEVVDSYQNLSVYHEME